MPCTSILAWKGDRKGLGPGLSLGLGPGFIAGFAIGLGRGLGPGFVGVVTVGVARAELLLSSEASEEFSRFQLFLLLSLVLKLGAVEKDVS